MDPIWIPIWFPKWIIWRLTMYSRYSNSENHIDKRMKIHMGIHRGFPYGSPWGSPQKSCGYGMGMGMEIPLPRQPCKYSTSFLNLLVVIDQRIKLIQTFVLFYVNHCDSTCSDRGNFLSLLCELGYHNCSIKTIVFCTVHCVQVQYYVLIVEYTYIVYRSVQYYCYNSILMTLLLMCAHVTTLVYIT